MKKAQVRDAVHREMFYFRKSLVPEDNEEEGVDPTHSSGHRHDHTPKSHDHEYTLMSIDTIVNGKVSLIWICERVRETIPIFFPPPRMNSLV